MKTKIALTYFLLVLLTSSQNLWANNSILTSEGGSNVRTGHTMQVQEFSGAMTYDVNLPVPMGRNNLEVPLGLNYNSLRRNPSSWVGFGWEMDFGQIVRLAEDGVINFFLGQKFEYRHGGQSETLEIAEVGVDPNLYGIDMEDYGFDGTESPGFIVDLYRPLIQSSFNIYLHLRSFVIDQDENKTYRDYGWIVIDKSGRKFFFGSIESAKQNQLRVRQKLLFGNVYDIDQEEVSYWNLNMIEDVYGNRAFIDYDINLLPDSIRYQDIQINFTKVDAERQFPAFRLFLANRPLVNKRLTRISIYQNDDLLHKYEFNYDFDRIRGVQNLASVSQIGENNESLPPLEFDYYETDTAFFEEEARDYKARRAGQEGLGFLNQQTDLMDMNGDGLVDQVVAKENGIISVYLNDGEDFNRRQDWNDPFYDPDNGNHCKDFLRHDVDCKSKLTYSKDGHQILFLMDINGDRLPDRIGRNTFEENGDERSHFYIAINTGRGFKENVEVWLDPYSGTWSGSSDQEKGFIDMNGDGLVDRIVSYRDNGAFKVYYNLGDRFEQYYVSWKDPLTALDENHPERSKIYAVKDGKTFVDIRDMNGDGLPDRVIKADLDNQFPGLYVHINQNGRKWAYPTLIECSDGSRCLEVDGYKLLGIKDPSNIEPGYISSENVDWIDMNGDGYLDRVKAERPDGQAPRFRVWTFQGSRNLGDFIEPAFWNTIEDPVHQEGWDARGYITKSKDGNLHTFFRDMDSDGFVDRVSISEKNNENDRRRYFRVHRWRSFGLSIAAIEQNVLNNLNISGLNQPNGYLKSVKNSKGEFSTFKYIPSVSSVEDGVRSHRYLPMSMHLLYLTETLDHTIQGMNKWRRTFYYYKGGNYLVRYADQDRGHKYYARFNGFNEVYKISLPAIGEDWKALVTRTKYHQSQGNVYPVSSANEELQGDNIDRFKHYALAGRVYGVETFELPNINDSSLDLSEARLILRKEASWRVNSEQGSQFDCFGACYVNQSHQITTKWDGNHFQTHRADYDYDNETGNLLEVVHRKGPERNSEELYTAEYDYYDESNFLSHRHIRGMPQRETLLYQGEIIKQSLYIYNQFGRLIEERMLSDEDEEVSSFKEYNDLGNLISFVGIDGVRRELIYDEENIFPVEERVSDNGRRFSKFREYDRFSGNVTTQIDYNRKGIKTDYDSFGRETAKYKIESNHNTRMQWFDYVYEDHEIVPRRPIRLLKTVSYEYQPDKPIRETVPTQITYHDPQGRLLQSCVQSEDGRYRRIFREYINAGREERQTEIHFSQNCDFVSDIPENLSFTEVQKDYQGRTLRINFPEEDQGSPRGNMRYTYHYDQSGLLNKTIILPEGRQLVQVYDHQNRLIRSQDNVGRQIQYDYSPIGHLIRVSLEGETQTEIEYDFLGRKTSVDDQDGGLRRFQYLNGRLHREIDANGKHIVYEYNNLGMITQKEYFSNPNERADFSYVYSYHDLENHNVNDSELAEIKYLGPDGEIKYRKRFSYHNDSRLLNRVSYFIPGLGEFNQIHQYDEKGRLSELRMPTGQSLFYQYTHGYSLNKICSHQSCESQRGELYYQINPEDFNANGNKVREVYGNGIIQEYDYYPHSHRLKSIEILKGETTYVSKNYSYDDYSNILSVEDDANNPLFNSGIENIDYDAYDRLRSYQLFGEERQHLDYDFSGNILRNTFAFGETPYEYSQQKKNRLIRVGDREFRYDANGNIVYDGLRDFQYDAANRLSSLSLENRTSVSFDYDEKGFRYKKQISYLDPHRRQRVHHHYFLGKHFEIRDNKAYFHVYANDNLIATHSLGNLNQAAAFFGGDGLDRYGASLISNPSVYFSLIFLLLPLLVLFSLRPIVFLEKIKLTRSFYKLWKEWSEIVLDTLQNLNHQPLKKLSIYSFIFIFIIQFSQPAYSQIIPSEAPSQSYDENYFYYVHNDYLGSNTLLTEGKESSVHQNTTYRRGDLLQKFEFTPFGQEYKSLNPNFSFEPSYTGQRYDISSGLYYYKSRYYDPVLGRFLQADTYVPQVDNPQSYNRYSYVINNPLKYIDPSGHINLNPFSKKFWTQLGTKKFWKSVGIAVGLALAGVAAGLILGSLFGSLVSVGTGAKTLLGTLMGGVSGAVLGGIAANKTGKNIALGIFAGFFIGSFFGAVSGSLMDISAGSYLFAPLAAIPSYGLMTVSNQLIISTFTGLKPFSKNTKDLLEDIFTVGGAWGLFSAGAFGGFVSYGASLALKLTGTEDIDPIFIPVFGPALANPFNQNTYLSFAGIGLITLTPMIKSLDYAQWEADSSPCEENPAACRSRPCERGQVCN